MEQVNIGIIGGSGLMPELINVREIGIDTPFALSEKENRIEAVEYVKG